MQRKRSLSSGIMLILTIALAPFSVLAEPLHLNEMSEKYLQRLGFESTIPQPTLSFLSQLQTNHIHTFTHDTLDAYYKRPISLDPQIIITKFLAEQHGGLCFELNGAFCFLLQQLGFDAILVSAYVHRVEQRTFDFPIDTHAVIIVTINEQQYLVDVGFGNSLRTPIALENGMISDVSGSYKVGKDATSASYGLYKYLENEWLLQYSFTLRAQELKDFQENLDFAPKHWVSSNIVCTLGNAAGAHILLSRAPHGADRQGKLIIKSNGDQEEIPLATDAEIKKILVTCFGMSEQFVTSLPVEFSS